MSAAEITNQNQKSNIKNQKSKMPGSKSSSVEPCSKSSSAEPVTESPTFEPTSSPSYQPTEFVPPGSHNDSMVFAYGLVWIIIISVLFLLCVWRSRPVRTRRRRRRRQVEQENEEIVEPEQEL